MDEKHHIGIIGTGPIGLYAGCVLAARGAYRVSIYERGEVAENVKSWEFVELFSKTELNLPNIVRTRLEESGFKVPENDAYISGGHFRSDVLLPLAEWISNQAQCTIKTNTRVKSVGRGRLLKAEGLAALNQGTIRRQSKFRVLLENSAKEEWIETCDVLIDASGTYSEETALRSGMGGIAAPGEKEAEALGLIRRLIPDPNDTSLKNKRVAVLGSGYSAITALRNLVHASNNTKPASVYWLLRSDADKEPYPLIENDPLPQRSALSHFGNQMCANENSTPNFKCLRGVAISSVHLNNNSMDLTLESASSPPEKLSIDLLISLVGYKPNNDHLSELQVHMCYASDGPIKLAATLLASKADGGSADCLAQAAPGVATLQNPEPFFYIIGMRSYGRNSSFLMRIGYEQVDLLVDTLSDLLESSPHAKIVEN